MYFSDGTSSARIHYGEIIAVNSLKYTAKVKFTQGRIIDHVGWLSPYAFLNGNGMYYMPQAGASVLLLEYASDSYVIIGSYPLMDARTEDRRLSRRHLNHGDICIQGSDQCYILLKRACEFINMQASPKCYLQLNSGNNTINISTQRAIIATDGGVLSWDSDPETLNTTFNWVFKDKADKDFNAAHLVIGYHNTEDPDAKNAKIDKSVFSFIVKEVASNEEDITETIKFKLIIGANGRILCNAESLMEIYRDFIDRYADSFIKDIAKEDISRESMTAHIYDTAKETANTTAKTIHHNKGS